MLAGVGAGGIVPAGAVPRDGGVGAGVGAGGAVGRACGVEGGGAGATPRACGAEGAGAVDVVPRACGAEGAGAGVAGGVGAEATGPVSVGRDGATK